MLEYVGLFVAAFLAATILPLPSEVPLAVIVRRTGDVGWPVAVATLGNYLGACTTYLLARAVARRVAGPQRPVAAHAARTVRRFGPPALLLSWVPLLGDALVVVAGASSIPFGVFSIWTAAGKAVRYAVVAWGVLA